MAEREAFVLSLAAASGISNDRMMAAWTALTRSNVESVLTDIGEAYNRQMELNSRALEKSNSEKDMLVLSMETKFHQLEKELRSTTKKFSELEEENARLRTEISETATKLRESKECFRSSEEAKDAVYKEKSELEEKLKRSEMGSQELVEMLDRKNSVVARLNDEWNEMSEHLSKANKLKNDAILQLGELHSKEASFNFKERRLTEEKELLASQNEWLQSQLKVKSVEMVSMRHEGASDRVGLKVQLSGKLQEVERCKMSVEELQKMNKELESKLDVYLAKMKGLRDEKIDIDEQHQKELTAQSKLASLYKKSAEESESRLQEMMAAVEELQQAVDQGNQDQANLEEKKEELETRVEQLESRIRKAEKDLETHSASALSEESLREIFPSAAASSSLMKSGMTLTQIYTELVATRETLLQEQEKNKDLNQQMNDILMDLENEMPKIQEERKLYKEASVMKDLISKKLTEATEEMEHHRRESVMDKRALQEQKAINNRLQQQVRDLGKQVQELLRACEEARGGLSSTTEGGWDSVGGGDHPSYVSSSSQVISERLVPFRSIEELQLRNQELVCALRRLSEQQEKEERIEADSRVSELKGQLDEALSDLEDLKTARQRQEEMVESVVRQRDMYRVLAQSGKSPPAKASAMSLLFDSPSKDPFGVNDSAEILQKEFDMYRTETSKNAKLLQTQVEEFREKASRVMLEKAHLGSQLEFGKERSETQKLQMESQKRELGILQERNQKMTDIQAKLEIALEKSRQELASVQENLMKSDHMQEMLKLERDQLKSSEQRLLQLNEELMKERQSQNLLLGNLQTLQANLEKNEMLIKTKLSSRLEELERELTETRRDTSVERQRYADLSSALQKRLQQTEDELKHKAESLQTALKNYQLEAAERKVLEQKEEQLVKSLEKAQQHISQLTSAGGDDVDGGERALLELRNQIKALQDESDGFRNRIQQLQQQSDDYKALSLANEESLQVANRVNAEVQQEMTRRLKEAEEREKQLLNELKKAFRAKEESVTELVDIQKKNLEQLQDLRQTIGNLKEELMTATSLKQQAMEAEAAANVEYHTMAASAQEAQDKYERELMLHSADVQLLQNVKEESRKSVIDKDALIQKMKVEQAKAEGNVLASESQIKTAEETIESLRKRTDDLMKQNEIIHSQADELSHRLAVTQPSSTPVPSMDSGEQQSAAELWEVIRFLRREKQIAETRCEVIEADCVRFKQRYSHVEQQLEETRKALSDEREKVQVTALTADQHAAVMEKVDNLNVYMESNKVLREEKNVLAKQVGNLEDKVKKLEGEISPLLEAQKALKAQRDALLAEKTALKNEVSRWTARTNHLIEQCNRVDPEEYKELLDFREKSGNKIADLEKDLTSSRQQLKSMEGEMADMGREYRRASDEAFNTKAVSEETQKELDTKKRDLEEKTKNLQSLRVIARKYRSQFEKAKSDLEQKEKQLEEQRKVQVDEATQEKNAAALEAKIESLQKEMEELRKENKDQAGVVTDKAEKLKRTQNVVKRSADKIKALSTQKETLLAEVKKLKEANVSPAEKGIGEDERSLRDNLLRQQHEMKISKLEQQLQQSKTDFKEMQEKYGTLLNQKLSHDRQMLQKRGRMKQTSSTTAKASVQVAAATQSSNVSPVTANVIPTVASTQATPTAAVKPIPAVSSGSSSMPTAAVLPTVGTSPVVTQEAGSAATCGTSGETAAPQEIRSSSGGGDGAVAAATEVTTAQESEVEEGELVSGEQNSRAPSPAAMPPAAKRAREEEDAPSSLAIEDEGPATKKMKVVSEEGLDQPQETEVTSTDVSGAPPQSVDADASDVGEMGGNQVSGETSVADPTEEAEEKMDSQEIYAEGDGQEKPQQMSVEAGDGGLSEGGAEMEAMPDESQEQQDEPDAPQTISEDPRLGQEKESTSAESTAPTLPPLTSSLSSQVFARPDGSRLQNARSELPRFSFAGHSSMHYDETEDSTVPHTPVLNQPGRTENEFAQMIASPLVSLPPRFPSTTSSQGEGSSSMLGDMGRGGPGIVSQSGMGMDISCIELLGTSNEQEMEPGTPQETQPESPGGSGDVAIDDEDGEGIDPEADSGETKPTQGEEAQPSGDADQTVGENVVDSGEIVTTEAEAGSVDVDDRLPEETAEDAKEEVPGSLEPSGLPDEFAEEPDIVEFNEEEVELEMRQITGSAQEESADVKADQSECKGDGENETQQSQDSQGPTQSEQTPVPRGRRIIIRSSQGRAKPLSKGKFGGKNGE